MSLISVIVPIYNTEKYLNQCVDSIINQTYKELEIILVDDGSTDESGKMCDQYAKQDNRVKVIHQKNAGTAVARNAGIDASTGEFIAFVDSDDWLDTDIYEILYKNLISYDADISSCEVIIEYKTHNTSNNVYEGIKICNKMQAIESIYNNSIPGIGAIWNKIFKKRIFNNLRFPVGKAMEDTFIFLSLICEADEIVCDSSAKYHYRQRKSSVTMQIFGKAIKDGIEANEKNLRFIENNYPQFSDRFKANLFTNYFAGLRKILNSKNPKSVPEYNKYYNTLKENIFFILRCEKIHKIHKVQILMCLLSPSIYILIFNYLKRKEFDEYFE